MLITASFATSLSTVRQQHFIRVHLDEYESLNNMPNKPLAEPIINIKTGSDKELIA